MTELRDLDRSPAVLWKCRKQTTHDASLADVSGMSAHDDNGHNSLR